MVKLTVEELGKDFLIPVIDRVSFTVEAGEFVCLLGPNGCGKTTLLRIVGGLEPATRGRVTLDGEPILAGQARRHKIGVVFQEDRLLPWLTLQQNVALVLKPLGLGAAERDAIARRYLKVAGLGGFEDYHPAKVSGGMRQRAAIARALAIEPDVLLMDEPFGALDAMTRDLLHDELEEIWQNSGLTVLFVTHNVRESVRLADRVVLLTSRPGRVAASFIIDIPRPRRIESAEVAGPAALITDRLREEVRRHGI